MWAAAAAWSASLVLASSSPGAWAAPTVNPADRCTTETCRAVLSGAVRAENLRAAENPDARRALRRQRSEAAQEEIRRAAAGRYRRLEEERAYTLKLGAEAETRRAAVEAGADPAEADALAEAEGRRVFDEAMRVQRRARATAEARFRAGEGRGQAADEPGSGKDDDGGAAMALLRGAARRDAPDPSASSE